MVISAKEKKLRQEGQEAVRLGWEGVLFYMGQFRKALLIDICSRNLKE